MESVASRLVEAFPGVSQVESGGHLECPASSIAAVAEWVRDSAELSMLADLSVVDWLGQDSDDRRFEIAYEFLKVESSQRLSVRVRLTAESPSVDSLAGLFISAVAFEREAFDFFGIDFVGHPNLARMFMPEDWDGHPQRKDYPLGGIDVLYENDQAVAPVDERAARETTTSGFPGRTS